MNLLIILILVNILDFCGLIYSIIIDDFQCFKIVLFFWILIILLTLHVYIIRKEI